MMRMGHDENIQFGLSETIWSPLLSPSGVSVSQHIEHIRKYELVHLLVPSTCGRDQLLQSPGLLPALSECVFGEKVETFGKRKGALFLLGF